MHSHMGKKLQAITLMYLVNVQVVIFHKQKLFCRTWESYVESEVFFQGELCKHLS